MEKIAFVMQLKPGCEEEYELRHDHIWQELKVELKLAGISDYSIFLHSETLQLFGVLKRRRSHGMDRLPQKTVMQKWWNYMADLMVTEPDNSPQTKSLVQVFHLA